MLAEEVFWLVGQPLPPTKKKTPNPFLMSVKIYEPISPKAVSSGPVSSH